MPDYKSFSDNELLGLLKTSDHLAFNEILKRYSAILINFAYRKLSDLPLAEDLVYDVFTDLWEKRETQTIFKGLEPFIFTSVRNRILDHFRREKVSKRYIDNSQNFLSDEYNTTDYLVRHNDLSALIEREIAALPEKMGNIFLFNRRKYMTVKEISTHFNIPENSVNSNIQRALKILKRRLGNSFCFIFIIAF